MEKEKTKIIYYRENAIQSIIADTYTFGVFFMLLTINYKFWNGDWYVTVFLLILWFLFAVQQTYKIINKVVYTDKQKLIEDLQNELEKENKHGM